MVQKVYQVHEIQQALELLHQHTHQAKLLAGGTDLIIKMREGHVKPAVLIDISSMDKTRIIEAQGHEIHIGSTATFSEIQEHPLFQEDLAAIAAAARSVGSPQIRNRATIGGNICNASPAADLLPPLLAMEAMTVLRSKEASRLLPLSDFLVGKEKTALKSEEMLERVWFRQLEDRSGLGFSKLGIRNALAIARLSMAVYLKLDATGRCLKARVASGALGLTAQRENEVEAFLQQQVIDETIIDQAAQVLERTTAQRLAGRSTLPFKRHAVQGVFRDALSQALKSSLRREQS
ncbi:FAD binding domain-containing protein [Anoxynatronum sibiricum]|uniref:FAD binding domain-containing protein n=1 Tax=Anoxynatronum sibiricum TaxID=210623 RepID=A0ABU9VPC8_9CLOT